jgi:hypothetical protein
MPQIFAHLAKQVNDFISFNWNTLIEKLPASPAEGPLLAALRLYSPGTTHI